jgi:hypothetical protein
MIAIPSFATRQRHPRSDSCCRRLRAAPKVPSLHQRRFPGEGTSCRRSTRSIRRKCQIKSRLGKGHLMFAFLRALPGLSAFGFPQPRTHAALPRSISRALAHFPPQPATAPAQPPPICKRKEFDCSSIGEVEPTRISVLGNRCEGLRTMDCRRSTTNRPLPV